MPFITDLEVKFNSDTAILLQDLVYRHNKYGEITVKAGFETDFASVPGYVLLPGLVPRVGKVKWSSVVHDWIYRGHEFDRFNRKQADKIFLDAAIECGMDVWRAYIAYLGVRVGGWAAWKANY